MHAYIRINRCSPGKLWAPSWAPSPGLDSDQDLMESRLNLLPHEPMLEAASAYWSKVAWPVAALFWFCRRSLIQIFVRDCRPFTNVLSI